MRHAEMSQLYYWKKLYMDIAKAVKKRDFPTVFFTV